MNPRKKLRVNIKPNTAFNNSDFHLDGYTAALDGYIMRSNTADLTQLSNFGEMLVNNGVYNDEQIVSEEGIKLMTKKYSNGFPDPSEPNAFPLEGYVYGFTFSVLEDSEWGSGAPSGIYGWSGYTWYWIDPTNNLMSNSIEPDFRI